MIKLITPPGMLLTVALLAIFATYGWLVGTIERSGLLLVGAGLSVVAAVGVALLKPWSRYLVYVLTTGFIAKLASSVYGGFHSGYFSSEFGTDDEILFSLMPSVALAILALICCWLANRHFTKQRAMTAAILASESAAGSHEGQA